MTRPLQHAASTRGVVALVFAVIAATYVIPMLVPDPSLVWASEDEVCCHVPTILAIQREGVGTAVTDYKFYRSATTPLYHMIMSVVLGHVDPVLIRAIWIAIALAAGALFYRLLATDVTLRQPHRAAFALSAAFLLSPTIRAAAIYFVTDGFAAALAIAALVALRRAQMDSDFSVGWSILAVVLASASFYTRQYYIWVTLYVAASLIFGSGSTSRIKIVTVSSCVLLAIPAVALFRLWRGFTPPLGFAVHTDPALLSTVPNVLGLVAIYALPLAWAACLDDRAGTREAFLSKPAAWLVILGAMLALVAAGLALGLEIPAAGGILHPLGLFGRFGRVTFLVVSSVGVIMLARWLIVDGRRQLWWFVFLAPLLAGSIVLQRYVEPAILVFMFLVARPADALKVLDSRLVWFYPLFTAVYALSRTILFASIV